MISKNLIKQILSPALGFGLGGLIWGVECYRGAGEAGQSPFMFILGALSLGLFGGLSLVVFERNIKKIIKVTGLGIVGCLVGFLLPGIFGYWLFLGGNIITLIYAFFSEISGIPEWVIESFTSLKGLEIASLWLEFLLTGAIIGLFYTILLKIKIRPLILRTSIGFALASLTSPIIGNLFGNLLVSYLITFSLLGIIFGLFLQWGISKAKQQ